MGSGRNSRPVRSTRLERNLSNSPADAPETRTTANSSRNPLAPEFAGISPTRSWSTAAGAGFRRTPRRRSLHARPSNSRGPFPCARSLPNNGHTPSARPRAPPRWPVESRSSALLWACPYRGLADAGKRLPDPAPTPLPVEVAHTAQALRPLPSDRERSLRLCPKMTAVSDGLHLLFSPPGIRPPAIFRELTNMNHRWVCCSFLFSLKKSKHGHGATDRIAG